MLCAFLFGILSNQVPYLLGQNSLLREGPGIAVKPLFVNEKTNNVDSTLIYVSRNSSDAQFQLYSKYITEIFDEYKAKEPYQVDCNSDNYTRGENQACRFPLEVLDVCGDPIEYLKATGIPCIYLRINQIYGWFPDVTDGATTPLVECYGQNTADRENMGVAHYYPNETINGKTFGRFSHAFFPYDGNQNYSAPLVAMTLPKVHKNVVVLIKCQLRGITSNGGETPFELMVDDIAL